MKIAIASNNEQTVSYHLGRAQGFVVVEIEDGQVKGKTYRSVSGVEPVGAGHQHRHGQGCCEEEGSHQHRHRRREAAVALCCPPFRTAMMLSLAGRDLAWYAT